MMLSGREDYYVSLDDDAWFLEGDEIAVAVEFLERHPNVAAVAFDVVSPDKPATNERGKKMLVHVYTGCGHILRLAAVRKMGGYCEFPGTYGAEEMDLCLRLIDAGHEIVQLSGVHVWHDKTPTARDQAQQHSSGVCNDLTVTVRRVPLGLLMPVLSYKLALQVVFAFKHGLLKSCTRGIGQFAIASGGVWRSRHPVRLSTLSRYRSLAKTPQRIAD
jgi:GT2 family glycosyltransferase